MPLLGLIGNPVSHSGSPAIYSNFFADEPAGIWDYQLFHLNSITELQSLIESRQDLIGFNVTIPYKTAIIPLLDNLKSEAELCNAVNTVTIDRKGIHKPILTGYNTDVGGFAEMLNSCPGMLNGKVLILGTGGSSNAVAAALSVKKMNFVKVGRKSGDLNWNDLTADMLSDFQIIVNTTPLGMFPAVNDCPPLPWEGIGPGHILLDLVYNPAETQFIQRGREKGAFTLNGQIMLQQQAALSWQIFKNNYINQ
jgi:shikimate dehydrogenase